MAISVDWPNGIINIPRNDLTLVQTNPSEVRQLDLNWFRLQLKALEASVEGMPWPITHTHNQPVTVGGVTLARVVTIVNNYTITFEDGQYAVNLVGANSNSADRVNVNQVSVRASNSAGLVQTNEIEIAAYGGGISFNQVEGVNEQVYPAGTPSRPVNNLTDVLLIQSVKGLPKVLYIYGDADFTTGDALTGWKIIGRSTENHVHLQAGALFTDCYFELLHLEGEVFGKSTIKSCSIDHLDGVDGTMENCRLAAEIHVASLGTVHMDGCSTSIATMMTPNINCSADGDVVVTGYKGQLKIENKTTGNARIVMAGGKITVDPTCTGGMIHISGNAALDNQAAGANVMTEGSVIPVIENLSFRIESMHSTHQGYGVQWYVDVVSGRSTNDGRHHTTALATIAQALAKCVDGRNDVIQIINPSGAGVVHNEDVIITKNNIHVRGPGRDFTWRGVAANGTILTVDGYNCSFRGVFLDGNSVSDYCAVINGKHSEWHKPWAKLSLKDCVLIRGGDYHEFHDVEFEKSVTGAGIATFDAGLASGSPREITIMGQSNIYLNGGDGIRLDSNLGAAAGQSTRLIRILEGNISHNTGYGVALDGNVDRVMISEMAMMHGNTLGETNDGGTNVINMHNEHLDHQAMKVWAHSNALSKKVYMGLN